MRRLRVLQVTHDLHPGGLPRVVDTLCRTLDPELFDLSVLCLHDAGALSEQLRADLGVATHVLHPSPGTVDYLAALKVREFLARRPFDVVHTHNTEPLLDGATGALLAGVRAVVHTEHGRDWEQISRKWRIIERMLLKIPGAVAGVSDEILARLHTDFAVPLDRLHHVPNGIDGRLYRPRDTGPAVRGKMGVPEDAFVVGYASRLEPEKNVALGLEAFATLAATVDDAYLVLVGDGGDRTRLEALARELGVWERTRFLGMRTDVPHLLPAFDVHLLTSLREGMPMIILETMAVGCPTVATPVGGVPELVRHEENGLLAPGSAGQVAEALGRMAAQPALRRAMGDQARRDFLARYDARVMASRYAELYLRLLGRPLRPAAERRLQAASPA